MGAELDRLEVQIESKATKVNNSLDALVAKLDRVSGALTRINSGSLSGLSTDVTKFAKASAQLSNVKTTDFNKLVRNIKNLSTVNTKELYGASHAMKTLANAMNRFGGVSDSSASVTAFASSISKLGDANVQKAITNLPALAAAMNNLMATLSRAPQVSNNIIQMTKALAALSTQGAKIGTASKSLNQSLNSTGNTMTATTKKAFSLSSAIGKLYQSYYWVIRAGNKLWDSIESSMGYIENLNYFESAFGQVAEAADLSAWETLGQESAEAYYNSFADRAKELTSKMTGFNINDDGTLTATGEASLGINPSKLMNYQAMFAQMSSSMGVASETSLKLSQALTEIGADLASVKNMDFDKVWTDMASGLAGMSRTLDKYGVNIRNVNLQQKLFDLGINENITNLNQNDKALLRTIILLDSTKYAWGDLADTLNQPANQMRLLESSISNLSRTVGNLFLPMLSKVLPYVNGLVIALQRLATWLGNLMGIDLSEITSGIGSSEVDIGGLLDETDGLGDSLDDANDAAKKLKSNLQGFDELNVITTQDDSGLGDVGGGLSSGLLDAAFENAFSEYQKAWDEVFANMENRAEEFADKIEGYFQPIKDIINDFAIGDYFQAGQDTSNLVSGIFDFFADAIDNVDWDEIGTNIGEFLEGIEWTKVLSSVGKFVWEGIEGAIELWKGSFDAAPIETTIITAIAGLTWAGIIPAFLKSITAALSPKAIAATISGVFSGAFGGGGIPWIGTPAFDVIGSEILDGISRILEELLPDWAFDFLSKLGAGIVLGGATGSWFPGAGTVAGAIIGGIVGALDGIEIDGISILDTIVQKLFNFDTTLYFFEEAKKAFETAFDGNRQDWLDIGIWIVEGILDGFLGALSFIAEPVVDLFDWTWEEICNVFGIHSPAKEMGPLGEYILLGIVDGFKDTIDEFNSAIEEWFEKSVKPWFTLDKWQELGTNVIEGIKNGIENKLSNVGDAISKIADTVTGGIAKALDIHSPSRVMFSLGEFTMEGFRLGMENLYGNIQKSASEFGGALQYEIAPNPRSVYADIPNNTFPTTEYNNYSYYDSQGNYDASETNMLLRELITVVKEGSTIEIDGTPIFKTVLSKNREAAGLNRSHMVMSH